MSSRAQNAVLFTVRVVFQGDSAIECPIVRSDTAEMLRLLLHRLEVLEDALLMLAETLDTAAAKPCGTGEKPT